MNKNPYHLIGEPNASGAAPQKHGNGRSSGSQMTEHIVQLGEDRIKSSFAVYHKFHIGKSHWTLLASAVSKMRMKLHMATLESCGYLIKVNN